MEQYSKTPFTYTQHLELLNSRGLIISDQNIASLYLKQINYYRFTGYCIPFQKPHDVFISGTKFEKVIELYNLDQELRSAVFSLLSPIEIFIRTQIAYELSHAYGTFAQYETSIFRDEGEGKTWVQELEESIKDSREPFLQHFQEKYDGFPRLPIWMACEIMSLGSLSKFYNYLKPEVQRKICAVISIDHKVFKTWLHASTFVRNICAHHGRLWSRNLSISPMIPDKVPEWQSIQFKNNKLFTLIAILEWICNKAQLPVCYIEPVYEVMRKISALDGRFSFWMGVPQGKTIGLCWHS